MTVSSARLLGHWSMREKGAEAGNGVQKAVSVMETALWEMTLINQLSFIPEYKEYIGLGSLGTNPNLH